MFKLHDIRKTRVWQEAREEGVEEGEKKGLEKGLKKGLKKGLAQGKREMIEQLQANGRTLKEIAKLFQVPLADIRRLLKHSSD